MTKTAIRAEKNTLTFKNKLHEEFYGEYLPLCRRSDVYHQSLIYCLGVDEDTRECIHQIYDFKTGCVKPTCLHKGWITSGSAIVIRMAFNLYCSGMPSLSDEADTTEQLNECRRYTVDELFCSGYARYFWEAIKLRYPEYCNYVDMEDMFYAKN